MRPRLCAGMLPQPVQRLHSLSSRFLMRCLFSSRHSCENCVKAAAAGEGGASEAAGQEPHTKRQKQNPDEGDELGVALDCSWAQLSARLLLRDMKHFGEMPAAQIGDAGAVAAAIDPSVLTTKRMHVAVELRGQHTRGMTVVDPREWVMPPDRPKQPENANVSTGVDSAAVKRLFTAAVLTPPTSRS